MVEFYPAQTPVWVGNFIKGGTNFDYVLEHPNHRFVMVIAGGEAYIVDPDKQQIIENVGGMINGVLELPQYSLVVLNNDIDLIAYRDHGQLWRTRRISWDGIRDLKFIDGFIIGESWDPLEDKWISFKTHPLTGECWGGSYASD